jgi:hypothetical protein
LILLTIYAIASDYEVLTIQMIQYLDMLRQVELSEIPDFFGFVERCVKQTHVIKNGYGEPFWKSKIRSPTYR